jgi:hypothetical protein
MCPARNQAPGFPDIVPLTSRETNALRNYSLWTNVCAGDMEYGLTDRIQKGGG